MCDALESLEPTTTQVDFADLKELLRLDAEIAELSEAADRARAARSVVEKRLVEQFATSGVQSLNVDGRSVYLRVEQYANAKPEFRGELVAWARDNDLEEMIVVQPQRFKSWCKERLDSPEGLPAEIADKVNVFQAAAIRSRKS